MTLSETLTKGCLTDKKCGLFWSDATASAHIRRQNTTGAMSCNGTRITTAAHESHLYFARTHCGATFKDSRYTYWCCHDLRPCSADVPHWKISVSIIDILHSTCRRVWARLAFLCLRIPFLAFKEGNLASIVASQSSRWAYSPIAYSLDSFSGPRMGPGSSTFRLLVVARLGYSLCRPIETWN